MPDRTAASSSDVRLRVGMAGWFRWPCVVLVLALAAVAWTAPGADDGPLERPLGCAVLVLVAVVLGSMGVSVRVGDERLHLAFTPFYRRALHRDEIASVTAATWVSISFGGWGIKGWARSTKGLLLNASLGRRGDQGLRVVTTDGRTYNVEVPDPVAAAARVRELLDVPDAPVATS
jgi:hypothetical protein